MCGLAGVVRFDRGVVASELVARLDRALAHRGPDGRGSFTSASKRALLVHRRLAIIDPSSDSDQPMADPTGRWRLVYNGEFYNYRDIRDELQREGVRFGTRGDSEVLLQLIVRRGPDALQAVRGMFALALWDDKEESLLVARDRFGIKPLYIFRQGSRLALASELRALDMQPPIADAAVLAFLRWGSVIPPLTWREGVEALEPGTWRRWDRRGIQTEGCFARLSWGTVERPGAPVGESGVEAVVRQAIEDSVSAHLVSDVPVALFLSGGLDSASLLATSAGLGRSIECFTVADQAHAGEAAAAQAVAATFGATWQALRLDPREASASVADAVKWLDQPSIDGPNTWVISRAVARAGVKTALSGTGADELFGGYPTNRVLPMLERLGAAAPLATQSAAAFERLRGRAVRAARLDHAGRTRELRERYRAVRGYLLPSELARLVGGRLSGAAGEAAADRVDAIERELLETRAEPALTAVARAETSMYLRSQLLRDLDVMSMAHGLEVRVPFVDHVLLASTWPLIAHTPRLLRQKQILRRLLKGRLPPRVLSRRKTGFTLPFHQWMHRELHDFVREGIRAAEQSGWIASCAGERVLREWRDGRQHWSRPWGLAVLGHHAASE